MPKKTKTLTYGQLPELVGYEGEHPVMRCSKADTEGCFAATHSANRGDYWSTLRNKVPVCPYCDAPMELVVMRPTFIPWKGKVS